MPLIAFRMVQAHAWIRDALRARFPVLFVDEYQDLGHALHELVLQLCFQGGGIRLFAVGDADQSIYGFAGANPELLLSLTQRPGVRTVRLRFNYRCGTKIIDASMAALGEERGYQAPDGAAQGTVIFRPVPGDLTAQAKYIVDAVVPELLTGNVAAEEIAILYRTANEGSEVAKVATDAGLPIVRSDNQALVRRNSRLSRLIESAANWVAGGWKDGQPPFRRLVREAVSLVYGPQFSTEERYAIEIELITFLHSSIVAGLSAHRWLICFREQLVGPWKARARSMTDEWSYIDEMIERTEPPQGEDGMSLAHFGGRVEGTGRLNLSTFHSAKGREFDVVILFAINDDVIPSWRDQQRP
jgi:DNA helicase-2/ATP-dependent DNA helicase PcrA